jgi:hypothetical protein
MPRRIVRIWANRETCSFHEAFQTSFAYEMRRVALAIQGRE